MAQGHGNALPAGTEFEGYRIESVLGTGGFGITYRARETKLKRDVAIKEYLPRDLAMREGAGATVRPIAEDDRSSYEFGLERFEEEAQTLVRFRHPNIVAVFKFFEANGTAYLVMDYVEGESLHAILGRDKTLTEDELREILAPLLDGLETVHEAGYLHRDIKPGNIYIRADGSPVLLDFGAARHALGEKSQSLSTIVTAGYAPPEQYHRRGRQGPWTDIYALGATLYRAATGDKPPEAVERVMEDSYVPAGEAAGTGFTPAFLAAIDRALAVKESERPQTIGDWRTSFDADLDTAADEAGQAARNKDGSREIPSAPRRRKRRRSREHRSDSGATRRARGGARIRWLAAATAGVILAAAVGGYFWLDGRATGDRQAIAKRAAEHNAAVARAREKAAAAARRKAEARKQAEEAAKRKAEEEAKKKAEALIPGRVFRDCAQCPQMVVIPTGTFLMGSPPGERGRTKYEGPQRQVTTPTIAIGKYEVTFAEWDACVAAGDCRHRPSDQGWGRGDRPVINVSWNDAKQYVAWLSRKTGRRYRLPSEAEWEYAARAWTHTAYYWGTQASHQYANFGKDACCGGLAIGRDRWVTTAPVGSFPPNRFGLHDMSGNVFEWVEDCWHKNYSDAPPDGRPWTIGGNCGRRVLRGGAWGSDPSKLRSAIRLRSEAGYRGSGIGFRAARTLP